jgi:hypothetical protein
MKLNEGILKKILLMGLSGTAVAAALFTFASAAETAKSGDTTVQQEQTENKLTSEEIDKIIQDLKLTANIDNVLEKLDEIAQRAELSGNSALKEYAESTKTAYELQKQLDTVRGLIEAMKKKNGDIQQLDETLEKVLSVSTILEDLQGVLSDEALLALESLSSDGMKSLQETLAEIEELFDLNDVKSLTLRDRSLVDILMLDKAMSEGLFGGERLSLVNEATTIAVTILESYERQKYGTDEHNGLVLDSEKFASTGKKARAVFPEQVIFFNGAFKMRYAPVMYDGHILLAVDDLYQYIDAKIEYMYSSSTMVIQSPGKILEITCGKNVAYLNDEPQNMFVPILNLGGTIYMSGEFFAQAYDILHRYIPSQELLVFYSNLNQLKNPSVPNEVNRD